MQDNSMYVKPRKRKYARRFYFNRIVIFFTIICLAVAVLVVYLSTKKGQLIIKKQEFYFVNISSYTNYEDCFNLSNEIKSMGGAGYILNDGKFNVMASVYSTQTDATIVSSRLYTNGFQNTSVYRFSISELRISKFDDESQNNTLSDLIVYPLSCYSSLYDITLSYDTGEISESIVLLALQKKQEEIRRKADDLISLEEYKFITAREKVFLELKIMYTDLLDVYTKTLEKLTKNPTTSLLKELECNVIVIYDSLIKEING